MTQRFELEAEWQPAGDQPAAIEALADALERGERAQVLLGVTGSGKTFTVAHIIQKLQRPALVLAPNKILAAQLHRELKGLFPKNAVEFFISYYDYYQPEAYIPSTDTYIEKDSMINDEIDRMRHAATFALLERTDVVIVASVSCIYGIGAAESYMGMRTQLAVGQRIRRDDLLRQFVDIQYERNDYELARGSFRVRGDVIEIQPAYADDKAIRLTLWGDELERIEVVDPLRGRVIEATDAISIYPNSHYATPVEQLTKAIVTIREELDVRLVELRSQGKLLEAQRLEQRTLFDIENLQSRGHCQGIENYARHLSNREPGQPPPVLIDYFPKNFMTFVDESHVTVGQVGGMFRGDRARKEVLVEHGFRLPSAMDNRPLRFEEFLERVPQAVFLSATPGDWELEQTQGVVVEQLVRPTGLVDPDVTIRPVGHQVDDLLGEIRQSVVRGERVLVTTLTKRMAEHLTEYYDDLGVKVRYMHSDVEALERIELIRGLRAGDFDVLVGINLLREGLDLPEVALVAVLDADKEGFLRSRRSLIQTIGRAARNVDGRVILYADRITDSMAAAIQETDRRRTAQVAHNLAHGIVPRSIVKAIEAAPGNVQPPTATLAARMAGLGRRELEGQVSELRKQMKTAAANLDFERAARLRDEAKALEVVLIEIV
ncbi:MAG: excinuclease ABC subunit UvrB [Myxococcales bacterium]|nr:excinuclease ABC subunit UvrB [Myxococcales bacterium]